MSIFGAHDVADVARCGDGSLAVQRKVTVFPKGKISYTTADAWVLTVEGSDVTATLNVKTEGLDRHETIAALQDPVAAAVRDRSIRLLSIEVVHNGRVIGGIVVRGDEVVSSVSMEREAPR